MSVEKTIIFSSWWPLICTCGVSCRRGTQSTEEGRWVTPSQKGTQTCHCKSLEEKTEEGQKGNYNASAVSKIFFFFFFSKLQFSDYRVALKGRSIIRKVEVSFLKLTRASVKLSRNFWLNFLWTLVKLKSYLAQVFFRYFHGTQNLLFETLRLLWKLPGIFLEHDK